MDETRLTTADPLSDDESIDELLLDPSFYRIQGVDHDAFIQTLLDLLDAPASPLSAPASVRKEKEAEKPDSPQPSEKYIAQLLLRLGIPPHVQGYRYLCQAVQTVLDDPGVLDSMGSRLYPSIAQQYATNAVSVERSIRHAIVMAWEKISTEGSRLFQKRALYYADERPSNREFLALVSEHVRLKQPDR